MNSGRFLLSFSVTNRLLLRWRNCVTTTRILQFCRFQKERFPENKTRGICEFCSPFFLICYTSFVGTGTGYLYFGCLVVFFFSWKLILSGIKGFKKERNNNRRRSDTIGENGMLLNIPISLQHWCANQHIFLTYSLI